MTQTETLPWHLNRQTIWWPALVVFSLYILTEVGIKFILLPGLPWLAYKYTKWKKVANREVSGTGFRPIRLQQKTLLIAIGLAAIPAYVVSSIGPDHRAFYQELPYQAAREMGYSPNQALQMRPQILSMVNEPKGPFRTVTGWFWFLALGGLYAWRIYLFFYLRKSRSENEPAEAEVGSLIPVKQSELVPEIMQVTEALGFCVECGVPARSGDKFCGHCGHKH